MSPTILADTVRCSVAQGHLVSCSLDGLVKIWQPVETPAPGAVLDIAPVYVHPPEDASTKVPPHRGAQGSKRIFVRTLAKEAREDRLSRIWS